MSARHAIMSWLSTKVGFPFQETELPPALRRRIGELETLKDSIEATLSSIATKERELQGIELEQRKIMNTIFLGQRYRFMVYQKRSEIASLNSALNNLRSILNSKIETLSNDIFSELSTAYDMRVRNVSGGVTTQMVKETVKEIVMVPCAYCKALMPQTLTACPTCGANRRA